MNRASVCLLLLALGCSAPLPSPSPDVDAGALPDAAAPSGAVGSACSVDDDCRVGLTCFLGPEGARPWPNGYCTRPCDAETCPGDSRCGEAYDDASGATVYRCLATCDRVDGERGGCREGYFCMFDGACHVGCSSDAQCETVDFDQGAPLTVADTTCELGSGRCLRGSVTGGEVGEACTVDTDCRGPTGVCLGGACHRGNCDLGGRYACGDDAVCVAYEATDFQRSYACARTCTRGVDALPGAPGRCRATEACVPPEVDYSDTATTTFCRMRSGAGIAPDPAARVGDPCTTPADCPNPYGYGVCVNGYCHVGYCGAESLAGMDLCGDGATCISLELAPGEDTEFDIRDLLLGTCARDCSTDASVCSAGSTCNGTFCFP